MNWVDNEKYVWVVMYLVVFFMVAQLVRAGIHWLF